MGPRLWLYAVMIGSALTATLWMRHKLQADARQGLIDELNLELSILDMNQETAVIQCRANSEFPIPLKVTRLASESIGVFRQTGTLHIMQSYIIADKNHPGPGEMIDHLREGESRVLTVNGRCPEEPGRYRLRINLAQKGETWVFTHADKGQVEIALTSSSPLARESDPASGKRR